MLDTEVENRGKVFVTTELGGGGSATPRTVAAAKRGLRNVLHHAGILQGAVEMRPSVQLDMPDARCFVTSEPGGILEFIRPEERRVGKECDCTCNFRCAPLH